MGDLVTLTNRAGFQKAIGMPGTGAGKHVRLQKHIGKLVGDGVSGMLLPTTWNPAIVMGNMHFQQISVMGLVMRPTQPTAKDNEIELIL